MLRAIIQIESNDTVTSSMNSDTTECFDREDCAPVPCSEDGSRLLCKVLHTVFWRSKSSLHNKRDVTTLAVLLIQYIMILQGTDDDLCAF